MDPNRREFLKKTCLTLGVATAAGAVARTAAQPKVPAEGAASGSAAAEATGPATGAGTMPVLTPSGHMMHMPMTMPTSQPGMSMPPAAEPTGREGVAGRRWVMVIDLAKCDGCGKCTEACGKMHFIPPDRQWIPVLVMRESATLAPYYFPRPCFHCDIPPCTKVCPVNATYKTQDGTVLIDNHRCIGCRFCIAACPYGVRCFNWGPPPETAETQARGYSPEWGYPRRIGTVEKCDFCPDHAAVGELPACSAGCPMQAILFGDENEDAVTDSAGQTFRLSALLRDRSGYRHLEELGTHPRCYYLPPVHRQYPAPDQAKKG